MTLDENDHRIAQAEAWEVVFDTLMEVSPDFTSAPGTGLENAVQAIKVLGEKARAYDHLMALIQNSEIAIEKGL